jgi:hypothetical protein
VLAEGFKKGIKEFYPDAQIVGEDYHKLFLTDFAPYLEKIKASGAEVVFTGDWIPDAANLLKQARQAGVAIPFAHVFLDEPNFLHEVGVEGTKGLVQISQYGTDNPSFKTPEQIKYYKTWNDLWKTKWKTAPSNSHLLRARPGNIGSYIEQTYWLLSVIERRRARPREDHQGLGRRQLPLHHRQGASRCARATTRPSRTCTSSSTSRPISRSTPSTSALLLVHREPRRPGR